MPGLQKVAAALSRDLPDGTPSGIVLEPNMIASGVGHEEQAGPAEVERQAGRA